MSVINLDLERQVTDFGGGQKMDAETFRALVTVMAYARIKPHHESKAREVDDAVDALQEWIDCVT